MSQSRRPRQIESSSILPLDPDVADGGFVIIPEMRNLLANPGPISPTRGGDALKSMYKTGMYVSS